MIKPLFAWYDFWVGMYFDRTRRRLYVLPLPCIGFYVQFPIATTITSEEMGWAFKCYDCDKRFSDWYSMYDHWQTHPKLYPVPSEENNG